MFPKRNNRNFRAPVSSCQLYDCFNPDISSRPGVTATEDMAALPGVLGCSFDRLPGTMPGTGRTGSPCDVLFSLWQDQSRARERNPPNPPLQKGGSKWDYFTCNKSSSPFDKGGSRGILLRLRLLENHRSILTLQAKLNYTIPSIDGKGFETTKKSRKLSSDEDGCGFLTNSS